MAFPTITGSNNSNSNSLTVSHTVALPTNIQIGERLIVFFFGGGNVSISSWAGGAAWDILFNEQWNAIISIRTRIADGSEGSSINVGTSDNTRAVHYSIRVADHDPNILPEALSAGGTSASPNPPDLNPTNWGTEDTTWLAYYGWDRQEAIHSAYPSDYTANQFTATQTGTTGCGHAFASRELNAASENPGPGTLTASIWTWRAVTIGIKPSDAPVASGAPILSQLIANAQGLLVPEASGQDLLLQLIANGAASADPAATGTPNLSQLVADGLATLQPEATGNPVLPQLQANGSALKSEPITGDAAVNLSQLSAAGEATPENDGSGAVTLAQLLSGGNAATGGATGSGVSTLPQLSGLGSSVFANNAIGIPRLSSLIASGASTIIITAGGAVTLPQIRSAGKASPYTAVYRAISIVFIKPSPYGVFIHEPWAPYQRIADLSRDASNIDRTYERMAAGVASLQLPKFNSNNHTIHQGNILAIVSRDQPTWAGHIEILEDSLNNGNISILARELTGLLGKRTAPQDERYKIHMGSTYIFRSLIQVMNARGYTGINVAQGLEIGPSTSDLFVGGQTILQALEELHNRTDWEWWPEYDIAPGYVKTNIRWGYKQGFDLSSTAHLWHDIHFKDVRFRHDLSEGKQVSTVIGGFGKPLWERTSVSTVANTGPQRIDIGGFIQQLAPELIVRTIADLPASLRDERVQIEVTTEALPELIRRAKRDQERRLAAETQIQFTINNLVNRSILQVGNYITIHAPVGHHNELSGVVRLVGVQPDEELGEVDCIAEARV